MFRADLHMHSTFSDGELTPKELVMQAKEAGLHGISITDHDTIAAYGEVFEWAEKAKIMVGVGVEFSCLFEGISVHVLGYGFSLDGSAIQELCDRHRVRRMERNRAILKKLKACRLMIEEEELVGHLIGRPHIAELMVAKGYVPTVRHAFSRYLSEGKCCFVQGKAFSVEETLGVIHVDGGKAFLAHPLLLPPRKKWKERLLNLPFDGLEGYYARFGVDQEAKFLSIAQEKGLLISGGSDFHGQIKPHNLIGSSWVGREAFNEIFH